MYISRKALIFSLACCVLGGCGSSGNSGSGTSQAQTEETESAGSQAEETTSEAANSDAEASRELDAMDTYMTITAYGTRAEEAVDAAAEEIERLDDLLSTGNEDSEIAQLNANGSGVVSEDVFELVSRALEYSSSTGGLFEISIYPLMEEWGFTTQNYHVPDEATITELLTLVDDTAIELDEETRTVTLTKEGMAIDLGGIAKGYTSARVMDIFREYGIEHALVNLGGNVQVLGTKTTGESWRIGVEDPEDATDYLGILEAQDKAVITSGGYERYFEEDGKTYHHILDPATGAPAESGLTSVTIVSADGTLADAMSTSLFIMGKEKAVEYWREHRDEFDIILAEENGNLTVSEGLEETFSSEREVEYVS